MFSFLKTEIDSFVKGLSGKPEDPPAVPPKKRQKRSHVSPPRLSQEGRSEHVRYSSQGNHPYIHNDYLPLTEANLRASTSSLKLEDTLAPPPRRDRRSVEIRAVSAALSSYYSEEPVQHPHQPALDYASQDTSNAPSILSPPSPHREAQEHRRRKRERAATIINDEQACLTLQRQIREEEARQAAASLAVQQEREQQKAVEEQERVRQVTYAEQQRMKQLRRKEKDARDARRRKERAEALARSEKQQELEDEQAREREQLQLQEHAEQAGRLQAAVDLERRMESLRQQERYEAEVAAKHEQDVKRQWHQDAMRKEQEEIVYRDEVEEQRVRGQEAFKGQQQEAEEESSRRRQSHSAAVQAERIRLVHLARKEEEANVARRQREQTLELQAQVPEHTREQSLEMQREHQRVLELEAEVALLRRELEKEREQNLLHVSQGVTPRHVHFAPTPPASDTAANEYSFISISSTSSSSTSNPGTTSAPAPAPPAPPPPPPVLPTGAKPSPLALVAARRGRAGESGLRQIKNVPKSAIGMPMDMSKFLSEMKTTKLKKVGLPTEGGSGRPAKRDEEEHGLKSVLEAVLKKRFAGPSKDRKVGNETNELTAHHLQRKLSSSSSSSITSFSSYRPLDWSMDLTAAPDVASPPPPPMLVSFLRKTARHIQQSSTSSLPNPPRPVLPSAVKLSRTLSHPAAAAHQAEASTSRVYSPVPKQQSRQQQQFSTPVGPAARVSLLARPHARPHESFGYALTSESQQLSYRQKAQPYGFVPSSSSPGDAISTATLGLPQPGPAPLMPVFTAGDAGTDFSARPAASSTSATVRSAGSSFDVALYAQMEVKDDPDEMEEAMRRSLSNPPRLDGVMDLSSPPHRQSQFPPRKESLPQRYSLARTSETAKIAEGNSTGRPLSVPRMDRKASDGLYTHPRDAPAPPLAVRASSVSLPLPVTDLQARPRSPAKRRSRASQPHHVALPRSPLKTSLQVPEIIEIGSDDENVKDEEVDDDELLRRANISDEQAHRLLVEMETEDSILAGYS